MRFDYYFCRFDAHSRDPLGGLQIEAEDFAALTADIVHLAKDTLSGGVVSLLEGGYDLEGLESALAAHIGSLAEMGK